MKSLSDMPYLKVKAAKPAPADFFDRKSVLRADMQALLDSYAVFALSSPCLERSNEGSVPTMGGCLTSTVV